MLENLAFYHLSTAQWVLVLFCGLMIGAAKTGLSGAGLLVVPILAGVFGGKSSTGLLLPMLCFADVFAVKYYNRHANWKYVFKILPCALCGVVLGLIVGHQISEESFRTLLAVIIISSIILMIWYDLKKQRLTIPDYWWFSSILGLAGGFTTMVGNAAGPVLAIYLLSMRLPKNSYIGTGAWFFFIINLSKVPLHIFVWETITLKSFLFDLIQIPAIAIGAYLGIQIVKILPEKPYRVFIIATTLISAAFLFR